MLPAVLLLPPIHDERADGKDQKEHVRNHHEHVKTVLEDELREVKRVLDEKERRGTEDESEQKPPERCSEVLPVRVHVSGTSTQHARLL